MNTLSLKWQTVITFSRGRNGNSRKSSHFAQDLLFFNSLRNEELCLSDSRQNLPPRPRTQNYRKPRGRASWAPHSAEPGQVRECLQVAVFPSTNSGLMEKPRKAQTEALNDRSDSIWCMVEDGKHDTYWGSSDMEDERLLLNWVFTQDFARTCTNGPRGTPVSFMTSQPLVFWSFEAFQYFSLSIATSSAAKSCL